MDKHGFLLAEETLKIVVALISLTFLTYFLVTLYFSSQADKELELAEASLQHLIDEINLGSTIVDIYNPKGWVFTSWFNEAPKELSMIGGKVDNNIPKLCSNLGWDNCVCLCDGGDAGDCDKKNEGVCLEGDFTVEGPDKLIRFHYYLK
jgi:hypothetical protein